MTQIKFGNREPIELLTAVGGKEYVQGYQRDVLSLHFAATTDYEMLKAIYLAPPSSLDILNDGVVAGTHADYQVPVGLELKAVQVVDDPALEPVVENRYVMRLGQLVYTEKQQREQAEINAFQDEALIEIYELIGG